MEIRLYRRQMFLGSNCEGRNDPTSLCGRANFDRELSERDMSRNYDNNSKQTSSLSWPTLSDSSRLLSHASLSSPSLCSYHQELGAFSWFPICWVSSGKFSLNFSKFCKIPAKFFDPTFFPFYVFIAKPGTKVTAANNPCRLSTIFFYLKTTSTFPLIPFTSLWNLGCWKLSEGLQAWAGVILNPHHSRSSR